MLCWTVGHHYLCVKFECNDRYHCTRKDSERRLFVSLGYILKWVYVSSFYDK